MTLSIHNEPQKRKLRENRQDRLILYDSIQDDLTKAKP